LLKELIESDFDEAQNRFYEPQHIRLYGAAFISLLMRIADLAMEESFVGSNLNQKETFRNDLLVLVRFLFKTVKLSSLIHNGFTNRHLKFVLVHFAKSPIIPMVYICNSLRRIYFSR
jgi:hypothetical protein